MGSSMYFVNWKLLFILLENSIAHRTLKPCAKATAACSIYARRDNREKSLIPVNQILRPQLAELFQGFLPALDDELRVLALFEGLED